MSGETTSWIHVWIPKHETVELKFKGSSFQVSKVPEDSNLRPVSEEDVEPEEEDDEPVVIGGTESCEYRMKYFLEKDLKNVRFIKKPSEDGSFILYSFQVKSSAVESILIQLTRRGIGTDEDTSVSVVPEQINLGCIRSIAASRNTLSEEGSDAQIKEENGSDENDKSLKFYQTVKSRLMVTEVISRIRAGGSFTFDYCMLVILAGMIAFMGLIDNSSVNLVASMLVSPIMGPILAGIFGCVIQDRSLIFQGMKNEVISLLMCILLGMVLGIFVCLMILYDVYGLIDVSQWPSDEMLARGRTKGLITGVFVAIPSGAGIALSVLGGNAGSLVGVAISASLLPPAVNAGVYWSLAFLAAIYQGDDRHLIRGFDGIISREALNCPPSIGSSSESGNNFLLFYHCDLAVEAFVSGIVSLTLTGLNITCIIFTGFAILRIKEVTPDKIPQTFSKFWKKDIKAHRHYYNTIKTMAHVREQPTETPDDAQLTTFQLDGTFLQNIMNRAHNDQDYLDITRWVAIPPPAPLRTTEEHAPDVIALENIIEYAVEEEKKRSSRTYAQILSQAIQEEEVKKARIGSLRPSRRYDRRISNISVKEF